MKKLILISISFSFFFIACKKPPENKLAGKWQIESAFVNGTDRTAELDTIYLQYYEFIGWESSKSKYDTEPHVTLVLDQNKAHWEDSCFYYFGSWNTRQYSINEDKTELTIGSTGCTVGKSFIPSFIFYGEIWKIKKWKSKEFWVELSYSNNTYEVRFKKITE